MITDFDFESGKMLMIDKPQTWSSFDVVKKLRYALKVKKIGHAGTLDPLATGLLIICTGKYTKKIEEYMGQDKEYEGIIEIGKTTPSYDLETEFENERAYQHITREDIQKAVEKLSGDFKQLPPIFSAIKVNGKRAYKSARKNEDIELKERNVRVDLFEISKIDLPEIHFRIKCSKGTYIRSMAHDFGQLLGCGAYLKYLRRTAIGEFSIDQAMQLEDLIDQVTEHRKQSDENS